MPSPAVTTSRAAWRPGRSLSRSAAVAVLLVLLTGCASSPPTPVTSIGPLVGKWAGTVVAERGTQQFFYLTINADQTLVATWGINWSWGRVTLANGQATYQMNAAAARRHPAVLSGQRETHALYGRPVGELLRGRHQAAVARAVIAKAVIAKSKFHLAAKAACVSGQATN